FLGYIYGLASSTSKKLSESVAETAQTLKKSMEEGKINGIIDKFVSDAFDSCKINEDDLRKEMQQLVLDKKEHPNTQQEETADWERELQEELQRYGDCGDHDSQDDNWGREIEEMLKEES
ncbi:unnamed protein product, partial [Tetraodon nigroviridis]